MDATQLLWRDVEKIREQAPLIHNITNYVVMNPTANALLALGASPVMAHAREEMEEMTSIAGALVLNIGTLSAPWIAAMRIAAATAASRKIPVVLDPVGAGATRMRTDTALELLDIAPVAVIRGNASEIMALHIAEVGAKGVDSQHSSEAALDAARALALKYRCTVSVSGETDFIVQGHKIAKVLNGNALMTRVTGMGCSASAITGAFCAVNGDHFEAASHAMCVMGVAGEIAMEKSSGPGSLQMNFVDTLYNLSQADLSERLRVELVS